MQPFCIAIFLAILAFPMSFVMDAQELEDEFGDESFEVQNLKMISEYHLRTEIPQKSFHDLSDKHPPFHESTAIDNIAQFSMQSHCFTDIIDPKLKYGFEPDIITQEGQDKVLFGDFVIHEDRSKIHSLSGPSENMSVTYPVNSGIYLKATPAYTKNIGQNSYSKTGISMGVDFPLNDD